MTRADNHAERVADLLSMAISECEGDDVAAFAAHFDASVFVAVNFGVTPEQAAKAFAETFANVALAQDVQGMVS